MPTPLISRSRLAALLLCAAPLLAHAQTTPTPTPRPFPFGTPRPLGTPASALPLASPAARMPMGTPRLGFPATPPRAGGLPLAPGGLATPAPGNLPPPREVPLVEKKFDQLSDQKISRNGRVALDIEPAKWKHAETDNFIVHYRRATEAQKVVREVEYDLWYVASSLGAGRDKTAKKSHVYVFGDEVEWKHFLDITENPMQWAASYAHGDELFLNVRGGGNSGTAATFDSHTLAHETTHAVVARLYPGKRFPLWLNEGFAEYMGGASVAARKGITTRYFERDLHQAELPLEKLVQYTKYPTSQAEIGQLYQSSEKFVRFLMTDFPKDRLSHFIESVLNGSEVPSAIVEIYGDKLKDWADFQKRYDKFTK